MVTCPSNQIWRGWTGSCLAVAKQTSTVQWATAPDKDYKEGDHITTQFPVQTSISEAGVIKEAPFFAGAPRCAF